MSYWTILLLFASNVFMNNPVLVSKCLLNLGNPALFGLLAWQNKNFATPFLLTCANNLDKLGGVCVSGI